MQAILKAQAMGTDPDHMLADLGRVPAAELKEAITSGDMNQLPPLLAAAIAEAKDVLDTTRDPQLGDIVLDRWRYRDEMESAEATGSEFLRGYVRSSIDAANLRSLVRTLRMGKNAAFLEGVPLSGGSGQERDFGGCRKQRQWSCGAVRCHGAEGCGTIRCGRTEGRRADGI